MRVFSSDHSLLIFLQEFDMKIFELLEEYFKQVHGWQDGHSERNKAEVKKNEMNRALGHLCAHIG